MSKVTRAHPDLIKKCLLWLVVVDYPLLGLFLLLLPDLHLSGGTLISALLLIYNLLLSVICFHRTAQQDTYIIYPILSATLLAFVCFLYYFFLV
ncbi:hypothetical protein HGP28_12555 [Vibrio sp. SM6]|uniref:Uncharacterized protein n=1 Tax=Vibrio agarilyticus TaxID=2726741 RepID=A0A7X8TS13_9VIBR|nr:hypothetical protein [Vibrio agarilyticus]NLS13724.1 hypothetical protein [Vibrio agarilyticus]